MARIETRTEPMVLNMGPHHPSMHGVMRLIVTLDGEDVVPMYLGDDVTDEDAFRALSERGGGLGIYVGDREDPDAERETHADYALDDVDEIGPDRLVRAVLLMPSRT